jgi:thioester reductase-like protein
VFHAAASVQLHTSLAEARLHTLVPTQQMLQLLQLARRQKNDMGMEYVSTVGVLGKLPQVLTEEPLLQQRDFHNSYEAAKAESEALIYKAQEEGYKIRIHRPSMVVGHSESGKIIHAQVFAFLIRFLIGEMTLGLWPQVEALQLDTIPSDILARMMVASSLHPETPQRILHACSGPTESIALNRLQTLAGDVVARFDRGVSGKKPRLNLRLFKNCLAAKKIFTHNAKDRIRLQILENFLDYAQSQQKFSNERTRQVLAGWDLAGQRLLIPNPESYLPMVLERILQAR